MRSVRCHFQGSAPVGGVIIYCKIHQRESKTILAACDSELLGKTLQEGEIEFFVSESFYKGKKTNQTELLQLLEDADSVNLIGKKCFETAVQSGWVKKEDGILINSIPHVQIFKV